MTDKHETKHASQGRLVNEWDFDCHAVFSSLDAISKREMLWNAVAEAIADAVEAERAKARVVLPSDEDVIRYKKAFRLSEGTWPSVEYLARYMRSQAKIGWGEK